MDWPVHGFHIKKDGNRSAGVAARRGRPRVRSQYAPWELGGRLSSGSEAYTERGRSFDICLDANL